MNPGVVRIKVNSEVCQGCRSCEAACSVFHTGGVSPQTTGIRVKEKSQPGTFDLIVCQQCIDMPCAAVCPKEIIVRDPVSWSVKIKDGCIGCGLCAKACTYGAITMVKKEGEKKAKAFKCDLCGDDVPQCIKACPRNALSW